MQIKRYEAATIQEALIKIRQDLGEDAVILATKRLRAGKQPLIEVTAARDDQAAAKPPAYGPSGRMEGGTNKPEENLAGRIEELAALMQEIRSGGALKKELQEIKGTLNTFFDLLGLREKEKEHLPGIYYHLLSSGISEERARKITNHIAGGGTGKGGEENDPLKAVEDLIGASIPVSRRESRGKKTLAFIGPTGVGKTTTLAKLAARYALGEKMRVGLITTDTYRIAAVEQLKVYGKIMGIPVEVVSDGAAFRKAVQKFSDREAVLIDTPGRSQRDGSHILKLKGIIRDAPVETHLLLSPTASRENMLDAAERFGIMNYSSIIFTKLDECTRFGPIYDVVDQVGKPVSFMTNGQNVPQDIEIAEPGRIARLIVRQKLN